MERKGKQTEESSALFAHQLVTLADLEKFKEQMLSEMRRLLSGGSTQLSKQWLKSREVRKLLDVSPGASCMPCAQAASSALCGLAAWFITTGETSKKCSKSLKLLLSNEIQTMLNWFWKPVSPWRDTRQGLFFAARILTNGSFHIFRLLHCKGVVEFRGSQAQKLEKACVDVDFLQMIGKKS